jgi:hypothetical protein
VLYICNIHCGVQNAKCHINLCTATQPSCAVPIEILVFCRSLQAFNSSVKGIITLNALPHTFQFWMIIVGDHDVYSLLIYKHVKFRACIDPFIGAICNEIHVLLYLCCAAWDG